MRHQFSILEQVELEPSNYISVYTFIETLEVEFQFSNDQIKAVLSGVAVLFPEHRNDYMHSYISALRQDELRQIMNRAESDDYSIGYLNLMR